jgi:hypothetical protein
MREREVTYKTPVVNGRGFQEREVTYKTPVVNGRGFQEREVTYKKPSGKWEWVPGEGGYVQDSSGKWTWVPGKGSYVQKSSGKWDWVPTTRMREVKAAEAIVTKILDETQLTKRVSEDKLGPHRKYLMEVLMEELKIQPSNPGVKDIKPGHLARMNRVVREYLKK